LIPSNFIKGIPFSNLLAIEIKEHISSHSNEGQEEEESAPSY